MKKDYGVKCIESRRLHYYDPIKCYLIDPTHNFILGSAENVFECWIGKGILIEKNLEKIDQLIQEVAISSNVVRVAESVSISFKLFKMKS